MTSGLPGRETKLWITPHDAFNLCWHYCHYGGTGLRETLTQRFPLKSSASCMLHPSHKTRLVPLTYVVAERKCYLPRAPTAYHACMLACPPRSVTYAACRRGPSTAVHPLLERAAGPFAW